RQPMAAPMEIMATSMALGGLHQSSPGLKATFLNHPPLISCQPGALFFFLRSDFSAGLNQTFAIAALSAPLPCPLQRAGSYRQSPEVPAGRFEFSKAPSLP